MKIFVDMDHTLNKLYESYNEYYYKLYGEKISLSRETINSYYIHEIIGSDLILEDKRKYEIFNIPGFWENIPIYKKCKKCYGKII